MSTTSSKPRPPVKRLPPLPPPETLYHPRRKHFQLVCFLIFVALPFFNVIRVDIPRKRFYLAGFELWINEFAILFFALMFLMFLVAAVAFFYGRLYCSYACPQMIFSEWSFDLQTFLKKWINRKFSRINAASRETAARALFYSILAVASVFLAFVFTSYFVEPRDLISRLLHFDIKTAGGITGAAVTLITFLDFTFVRQKFCTTVCPYGYLQGVIQDKETLLVIYKDGEGDQKICIECGKCVRVCEMGIDIRDSPYQIECVHCGDCIDACEDVLRRVGRTGLIHYAWGGDTRVGTAEPWYKRWGFRDAKRVVILFVLTFYICGLGVALSMREPVLVQLSPDRSVLYKKLDDGRIANLMRVKIANRESRPVTVEISTDRLPGAEITLQPNPLPLGPGQSIERTFEIRTRPWQGSSTVNHFRVLARASGQSAPDVFALTFILPEGAHP
jgi:cytochrome c oxidase accessory protein FixG